MVAPERVISSYGRRILTILKTGKIPHCGTTFCKIFFYYIFWERLEFFNCITKSASSQSNGKISNMEGTKSRSIAWHKSLAKTF